LQCNPATPLREMSPGRGDISASRVASFKVVKETGMFDLLTLGTKFAQPACHEAPAAVDRYPLDPGISWYDRVRNDEVLQRTGLTSLSSPIQPTHLGIWARGSTWRCHTGKHGSSAPHQRITQPTS